MDLPRLLALGAVFLVLGFGVRRLLGARRRTRFRVPREGGAAVLRLPPGHHLLLGSQALVPTGIVIALAWNELRAGLVGPLGFTFLALLAAGGLAVLAWGVVAERRRCIRVDAWGVERRGVFTQRRIAWGDVAKLGHNPTALWFFLVGKDGSRIWIAQTAYGIADFADIALVRLPRALLDADPDVREALEETAALQDPEPVRKAG